jgi:hypothetical protein
MTRGRYAPGAHSAVVTDAGAVLIGSQLSPSTLAHVWSRLREGRGFPAVLEALTGAFGTSLTAIPSFAVAFTEGSSVRIAVRGDLAAQVETATGVELVTGAGVMTWAERVVADARQVVLRAADAPAGASAAFVLQDGVVRAAVVELTLDASVAAPEPVVPTSSALPAPAVPSATPAATASSTPSSSAVPAPAATAPTALSAPASAAASASPLTPAAPAPTPVPLDTAPEVDTLHLTRPPVPDEASPFAPDEVVDVLETLPDESRPVDRRTVPPVLPPTVSSDPASDPASAPSDPASAPAPALPPTASPDPAPAPAPGPAPDSATDLTQTTGYDHLWGATVIRSIEEAAVRPDELDDVAPVPTSSPPPPPAGADDADAMGDHDGATLSVAGARELRRQGTASDPLTALIESVPPLAAARAAAPGRVRLVSGQVVLLDRTVVVGRRPRSTRMVGTDLPHLIAVDSPQQDISRSHLELRVEGDAIVATDLHTTNGTTLVRSGADPVRLHPGEPTVVVPGDVLDLGDGQTLRVEGLG